MKNLGHRLSLEMEFADPFHSSNEQIWEGCKKTASPIALGQFEYHQICALFRGIAMWMEDH